MIIKGRVKVIKKPQDYYKVNNEVIIVAAETTPDIMVIMHYIKAIICETDNKLCHAAIISREYGKPLVMGVTDAIKKYRNGEIISINTITKKIWKNC
jgi:phosphoenolpyruvate synthase/pyruvate phosphate dikinase